MIKVYPERECGEAIRIGQMPPLENIRTALARLAAQEGLPVDVQVDTVKIGKGLASIGAPEYPCVVVYNKVNRGSYYCHVFAVEKHFNDEYVQMYLGGNSAAYRNICTYENLKDRNFLTNQLLRKAKRVYKEEKIYQERLMNLVIPAFQIAAQMSDCQAEEEARRQAEAEARRRQAEEEARRQTEVEARRRQAEEEARRQTEAEARRRQAEEARRQAEAEARRRRAEEEARRQAEAEARRRQADVQTHRQTENQARYHQTPKDVPARESTVNVRSSGLKEAYCGPGYAAREYLGGTRETCNTYRYRNGTLTWTAESAGTAYKNIFCRKCGKHYRVKKNSGGHRIPCQCCGKVIEVTC